MHNILQPALSGHPALSGDYWGSQCQLNTGFTVLAYPKYKQTYDFSVSSKNVFGIFADSVS